MINNHQDSDDSTEHSTADDKNHGVAVAPESPPPTTLSIHHHHVSAPLSFPLQMMEILTTEENNEIIRWLPHGKGFIVADKKRFANEIMPRYFSRSSKYTSFTRKLNRWNFTRVTRGPETGAYYHPHFQRGNTKMCTEMTCLAAKVPQHNDAMNPIALGVASGEDAVVAGCSSVGIGTAGDCAQAAVAAVPPQAILQLQLQQQAFNMTMAAMMQQRAAAPITSEAEPGHGEGTDSCTSKGSTTSPAIATRDSWSATQQQQFFNLYMQSQQQYLMQQAQQQNVTTTLSTELKSLCEDVDEDAEEDEN